MVRRARYKGLSVAGRLFARPSAYVEEGRMTSGGMAPHRLSKSIEHKFNVSGTQPKVGRARGRF